MTTDIATPHFEAASSSNTMRWAGRIVSALGVLFLAFDGVFKLFAPPEAVQSTEALGWSASTLVGIGVLQLILLVLYVVPRTSVLGALLWTGYLGGAVATHVRIGNPLFSHVLFPTYIATLLWLGLWLRDARVRSLLPLTTSSK
ncbi:MAG: DoxX family protein [Archangium sp.]